MIERYPSGDRAKSFSMYALAVCHTLVHVLEQAGSDLSRAGVMKAAAEIKGLFVQS